MKRGQRMNQREKEQFFYGYNYEYETKKSSPVRGSDEDFWAFIKDGYELLKKENPKYAYLQ